MAESMADVGQRRCEGVLADGSPCPEPPLDPLPGSGRPPQYCWTHTSAATRSTRLRRLGEAPVAPGSSVDTVDLPASVGGLLEHLAALEPAAQEVLRSAKAAAAAASAVSDAAADLEPSVVAGHVEQIRRAAADQVRDAGAQLSLMEERLTVAEAGRAAAEVDRVALAGERDEAVSELDGARQALARAVEDLQAVRHEATQATERAVILAGERDTALVGLATAQESLARTGEALEAARAGQAAATGRADALARERDRALAELDTARLALQQAREESAAARARALEAVSPSRRPRVGPVSGPRRSRRRAP